MRTSDSPYLSILIVSLEARAKLLKDLLSFLQSQPQREGEVEILDFVDDGHKTVGAKRNHLLKEAKGLFTAFIDDDDWVSDSYIPDILHAIKINRKLDCLGFFGIMTSEGKSPTKFVHSVTVKEWHTHDGVHYRPPNHLNPIRSQITKKFSFLAISCGEDHDWCQLINKQGGLKSEVFLGSKPLYFYRFSPANTRTQ